MIASRERISFGISYGLVTHADYEDEENRCTFDNEFAHVRRSVANAKPPRVTRTPFGIRLELKRCSVFVAVVSSDRTANGVKNSTRTQPSCTRFG